MPLFRYQATDTRGRRLNGMVDAASRATAFEKLKARGYFPTRMDEEMGKLGGGVGGEDLAYTLLQLAALLRSGVPLDEALESLAQHAETPRLSRALARVRVRLREGESMAGAMAEESAFPPMLVRMVGAGEEAGKPAEILERYSEYLRRDLEHRRALAGALSYPVLLVGMALLLTAGLLALLTPVLSDMYSSMELELPPLTRALVGLGTLVRVWGLPLLAGTALGLALGLRMIPARQLDRFRLRVPLLGGLWRAGLMARWSRTLGMLHGAGVPLVRALQMSRETLDNEALDVDLRRAEQAVERGESLAGSLARSSLVPGLLSQFLRTGERTGELEPMLMSAAAFYERELDRRRGALVRWLEPALIVCMGLIVALLVMSVLLPLSDLAGRML